MSPRAPVTALEVPARGAVARRGHFEQCLQAAGLAVLFAAPALLCVYIAFAADPDIWWHLRTGEWILEHRAVPHTDPFSVFGAGKPWEAYSWAFELLVLPIFGRWGLTGLVVYSSGMVCAITLALHHLIRRLQPDFHTALLLTLIVCVGMEGSFTPRPWLFSILFFVVELDILRHVRRTGKIGALAGLPILFALWANLHIQFVDGLVVLALAVTDALWNRWRPDPSARTAFAAPTGITARYAIHAPTHSAGIAPQWLCGVLIASLLATLVNPYGWHIYQIAFRLGEQPGVLNTVSELHAMSFRTVSDFCVLFLALAAAAALARARRFMPYETALLIFAAFVAFRSTRDAWLMAAVAGTILAAHVSVREPTPQRLSSSAMGFIALTAVLGLWLGFRVLHVNNDRLQIDLAKSMPVRAVEFVKSRGYRGPLFNDYNWGGYLIWALRLPVSIDGRAALHGDKQIERSMATWNAEPDWATDPQLKSARLVIGPVKSALIQVLRTDPRFELAFEDPLAAVFVARQ